MAILTIPGKAATDTIAESDWDTYIADHGNEMTGRAGGNQLVNGKFRVWQRGTSFAGVAVGTYTADRWQVHSTGSLNLPTVTRETTIIDASSDVSLKIVTVTDPGWGVKQRLEHLGLLQGRTLALRLRVRQGVASAGRAFINDQGTITYGTTKATTGAFVDLDVARTIFTNSASIDVGVEFSAAGTYYVDSAMLVIGPNPTEFVPEHPALELLRCQRYYEVHGGVAGSVSFAAYGAAGAGGGTTLSFSTAKGGIPTMTKNGTWAVTNCGQPAISAPTVSNYVISATTTALGAMTFGANSTDDTVIADWAP